MVSRSNFTQPVSISVTNKQTKDDPLCNLQHTFTHNCGQFSANLLKAGFQFNTFSTNVFEGPTPQALLSKATIFPNLPSTLHFQDANWWDQHIHIRASLIKKTKNTLWVSFQDLYFAKSRFVVKAVLPLREFQTVLRWFSPHEVEDRSFLSSLPLSILPSLTLAPAERLLLQLIIYK